MGLRQGWQRRLAGLRDFFSFNSSVRSLVETLNREMESPEKVQIRLPSHPAGFVRAISKRRLTMAEAYLKVVASRGPEHYQERLDALAVLMDNAWHAKTSSMPINTARVQIGLMKECVQARGQLRRQLELMSDFALASYGQEVVIRRLLRQLDLIEVPEEGKPLRELKLAWDGHLHDLLTQGTKTPSQLVVDAFIKGIGKITVVYYDLSDRRMYEEALEAGRILGVEVEIAVEFSVGPKHCRLHFMWIPPQDGTAAGLVGYLAAHRERLAPFFDGLVHNSRGRQETIAALLEEFNSSHLPGLNSRFRNLPFLQIRPLRVEELEAALGGGQASHIHLGQLVTEHIRELLHKRVLYLKNQYQYAAQRLGRGEFSSWEVENLGHEYQRARADYQNCRPDRMAEQFHGMSHKQTDYDSAFTELEELEYLVAPGHGRIVFIHPLSQGAREAVATLLNSCRLIQEVETFNSADSIFRDPSDIKRLNHLVELLNENNVEGMAQLLTDWQIDGIDPLTLEDACRWYGERNLLARCGSDYVGGVSQAPGMGFVFASSLRRDSVRLLEQNKHPSLPATIGRLVARQQGGERYAEGADRLYALSRPKPPVPNPVGDEEFTDRIGLWRVWRYLNPNLKLVIKILIGFTPAYLLVGPWYAMLWLGITGSRNIMADLISTAGLSVRLWRTDSIDKNNVANSMFWTGFSVPILSAAKYGFDQLWRGLVGTQVEPWYTIVKFFVIAFTNGLYISSHNRLRGFDRQVIRLNFFRTVLSWPLATLGSLGLDRLDIPAIVQSKIWSDLVAGVTEGLNKFFNRLKLRQRDLLELFGDLLSPDRTTSLLAMLDILFVWAARDRGQSALHELLRGNLQKLGPRVPSLPSANEQRLIVEAYEKLRSCFTQEGNLETLTIVILQHFSGRDAVILTTLVSEQHGPFAEWLERHQPASSLLARSGAGMVKEQ